MVNTNDLQSDTKVINIKSGRGNDGLADQFSGFHLWRREHLRNCPSGGGLCNMIAHHNLSQGSPGTHRAETTRLLGWMCCSFQREPYFHGIDFCSRTIAYSWAYGNRRLDTKGIDPVASSFPSPALPSSGARALNRSARSK